MSKVWVPLISLIAILLIIVGNASADTFTPSHLCSKPYKPFQFNSEWELENFTNQVRSYKTCIMDFIEEQEDAIQKHQDAAEEAITEWNDFVNYELN